MGDSDLTHLNKGLGTGCAFRGRALVEIDTALGEKLDENADNEAVEQIPREEILKLQPFLRWVSVVAGLTRSCLALQLLV